MKHTIRYIGISLAALVTLQACKVTKDYARPELALPAFYQEQAIDSTAQEFQLANYVDFFQDKNLVSLIDTVLAHNFDLKIATENLLASDAVLKSAKLNYLPDVNLQINAGVQRLSKNSMMGSFATNFLFEDYSFAPTVSWDIDFWGKLKREREEALAYYLSQNEAKRALQVQLIAQTAESYYNLLSLDQQLQVAQQVEEYMKVSLEMIEVQYEVGESNALAVRQLKSQISETRSIIVDILQSIKIQENAIQKLAGRYPDTVLRATAFNKLSFSARYQDGLPVESLTNRPDVKQYELLLKAANARVGIAKSNFYPSLKITGQGGLNSIKASNWFTVPASLFGNAAGGITQPIFNRKSIESIYQQALHQRESAVHQFRKSVVDAVEEVSTSMASIDFVKQQVEELTERKSILSHGIEEAQVLYNLGEANYLEVITVQQSYLQAELAFIAVKLKEINAYIALYKSLGGS